MERIAPDVLAEILLLLQLKHLLRCAAVCRRWRALVNGAPFLSRATSRYMTSRKVPPLIRPAHIAPSLSELNRWLRGGLDEEWMHRYLATLCNQLNASKYFTKGSASSYLQSTQAAIPPELYRDLFQPGDRRRPAGVDLYHLLKHFVAHGVAESVVGDVTRKLQTTYTKPPTLLADGNYWYHSFKVNLVPMWTGTLLYEPLRRRLNAWGILRKLIALMRHHKRWTTGTVKSRVYGADHAAGGWKLFFLMNARFTVVIMACRSD